MGDSVQICTFGKRAGGIVKIHVIPAWLARNTESMGLVYSEEKAEELKAQGFLVHYDPQERVCMVDRGENPKLACYMCVRGDSSYYMSAK